MKLLLDTHAFIWFVEGDPMMSEPARQAIEDAENEKWLSIASIWEMAIKVKIGKLRLSQPLRCLITQTRSDQSVAEPVGRWRNGREVMIGATDRPEPLVRSPWRRKSPCPCEERLGLQKLYVDSRRISGRLCSHVAVKGQKYSGSNGRELLCKREVNAVGCAPACV